eukprot:m51a1_g3364 Cyt b5 domain containing axonemal protein 2 (507) ;mRNA; r:444148-446004
MTWLSIGTSGGVCVPRVCDFDTCPSDLGTCSPSGTCVPKGSYKGMETVQIAYTTQYCNLQNGGCLGGACEKTGAEALTKYGVTGIAAVNPSLFGINQNRVSWTSDKWGQGCTAKSKMCYYVEGPGGGATVAITDRCAGYCQYANGVCSKSGTTKNECSACIMAGGQELRPSCACVGPVGDLYSNCCGSKCGVANVDWCDWCASNNHAHFDLDDCTFNHVCGSEKDLGSCALKKVVPYMCADGYKPDDGNSKSEGTDDPKSSTKSSAKSSASPKSDTKVSSDGLNPNNKTAMSYKRRRYYTPSEVADHCEPGNCWVSFFHKVYDLTDLIRTNPTSVQPIIENAGKDITHWFNPKTQDIRTYIHPETNLEAPYVPQGIFVHVAPHMPTSTWRNDFGTPWWKDEARYCIGSLSKRTRRIGVMNTLTRQRDELEVCDEETLAEILDRYLEHNAHAGSYTWKHAGRLLDMSQTLTANGLPDHGDEFERAGVDDLPFVPLLHLYFNDDLTIA